jgi:hypothetical protein
MAIAGDLTQGCNDQFRAGLQEFYIQEACNVTAATASSTAHSFTAITTASDWFKFEGEKASMGWIATGQDNGSYEVVADIRWEGVEKVKLKKIMDIINARKVCICAVSNMADATYPIAHVLGYDSTQGNQAYLTPVGTAKIEPSIIDGMNDVSIQFKGTVLELPREMVGTIDYNSTTVNFGS